MKDQIIQKFKGVVDVDGKLIDVEFFFIGEDSIYCFNNNREFITHYKSLEFVEPIEVVSP